MDDRISNVRVTRLTQDIRTLLHRGLPISTNTLHHIDSVFGHLSPVAMEKNIAGPEDSENSTLIHLLFSPDLSVQITLEKTLCQAAYSADDVDAVQKALRGQLPHTTLLFADYRLALIMPADGVDVFVNGLHIDRPIPDAIARAISRHLPADGQMAARVTLRNTRIVYRPPVADFLCRFFEHASLLQPDLPGCVETAVELLSTDGAETDLFRCLGELKTAYARMLRQATIIKDQLKGGNAETLMLQGSRLFQTDPREIQRRTAHIDAIAMAVYGRLPAGIEETRTLTMNAESNPRKTVRRIGHLFQ